MKDSDFKDISHSDIKNHSEILRIIDEIKNYESNFVDFDAEINPFIDRELAQEQDLIEIKHEDEKSKQHEDFLSEKPKKKKKSYLRKKKKKESKPKTPTTFKIGFNEKGNLVNLDLKQSKVKKDDVKSKDKFSFKKLLPIKKSEKKETSDTDAKSSKLSKVKSSLRKLNKLKRVIPNKDNSSNEEPEEE
jgi:hypothetical protein